MPEDAAEPAAAALVLYDGDCALCARSVQFLAPRDAQRRLRFAAIAGPHGRAPARAAGIDPDAPATWLLIDEAGRAHGRSDAILQALRRLKAPWPALGLAGFAVPRFVRDALYDWVAANRARWFGRACLVPDAAWADRVLD
ncbi:MAG: DUF393 domain-containing protein [Hyphomonadaceae bacterium]|nr:DUF393 domain-containing protein [Hyphomonadaceae bacterium]